ncbi:YjfB family protein [Natranaerobius thermophilus]|uniref:Uncharacterized protein n=1 Tax=Natranaerobius thermophilus (strain ATCC BAA-1301 / DSM 18059 / JW/NM-WN-LF) TaxID=457570 RepID=B2A7I7_NATTJ|nr:YjfB family protein [Natranaerobius thermophilus]ACB85696.1 conserved hypothetical protein [Natranaerobius thermophilus JW/NM-WN-LF]
MDIAALSSSLSQAKLHSQVSTSVQKLSMDIMENSKDQFMDLLESSTVERTELERSVLSHLGHNFDTFA